MRFVESIRSKKCGYAAHHGLIDEPVASGGRGSRCAAPAVAQETIGLRFDSVKSKKHLMVALVMVDFRQDSVIVIGVKQSQIFWSQSKKTFRSIDSRKIIQDNRGVLVGLRAALSFVVQEEESLVFRNRASQVETILV